MARLRGPLRVADGFSVPLTDFIGRLTRLEETVDPPALRAEMAGVRTLLEEDARVLELFHEGPGHAQACWIELEGARDRNVTLQESPADVAGLLRERLFGTGRCALLVSATLGVSRSLDYVRTRVGADEVQGLVLDSPFDLARQMRICLAEDIPEPENPAYAALLPEYIRIGVERSRGRALVLFTSQASMLRCADVLAPVFAERGWQLLVQSSETPRTALLEEFRRDVSSVLFGLDSYWMGVDVPGEALEHVIITKLPFAVPTHPLVETRMEVITGRGGNPFAGYVLPEAVLRVRQGLGRLIRSMADRGTVTFLDVRLLRRSYGRVFLDSLPRTRMELLTRDGDVRDMPAAEWS
jgi:ATP-dependent DNA helicase DinG